MKLYEDEYCVRMMDFPGDVHGCTRLTNDGTDFPNIYINDWLSPPARCRAFRHEMDHLEEDDFYNEKTIEQAEGY